MGVGVEVGFRGGSAGLSDGASAARSPLRTCAGLYHRASCDVRAIQTAQERRRIAYYIFHPLLFHFYNR